MEPVLEIPVQDDFSLFAHLWPVYELYKLVILYPDVGASRGSLNGAFVLQVIKDWRLENMDYPTELRNLELLEYVGILFNVVVTYTAVNP